MSRKTSHETYKKLTKELRQAIHVASGIEKKEDISYKDLYRTPIHSIPTTTKDWEEIGDVNLLRENIRTIKMINRNPNKVLVEVGTPKVESVATGRTIEKEIYKGVYDVVPEVVKKKVGSWKESIIGINYIDRTLSERNRRILIESKAFSDAKHTYLKKDKTTKAIIRKVEPMLNVIPLDRESLIASSITGNVTIYRLPNGKLLGAEGLSKADINDAQSKGLIQNINNKAEFSRIYNSMDRIDVETANDRREQLISNYFRAIEKSLDEGIVKEIKDLFEELNIGEREFLFLFYTSDVFSFDFIYNEGEYKNYSLGNKKNAIRSEIEALRQVTTTKKGKQIHTYPGFQNFLDVLNKNNY